MRACRRRCDVTSLLALAYEVPPTHLLPHDRHLSFNSQGHPSSADLRRQSTNNPLATRPLASLASVWTISPFALRFTPFYITLDLRASLRLTHPRSLRTHRRARHYHSVKLSGFRSPLFIASVPRRMVCRPQCHLHVFPSTFPL